MSLSDSEALDNIRERRVTATDRLMLANSLAERFLSAAGGENMIPATAAIEFVSKVGGVETHVAQIAVHSQFTPAIDPGRLPIEIDTEASVRIGGGHELAAGEFQGLVDDYLDLRAGDRAQTLAWREFDQRIEGLQQG